MSGNRKGQGDLFELELQKNGRWSVVERFREHEKEEAISRAKFQVTQPGVEAVRVVREVYDESDGLFKSRTIFRQLRPKGVDKVPEKDPKGAQAAPNKRASGPTKAVSRSDLAAESPALPPQQPAPSPPPAAPKPRKPRNRVMLKRVVASTATGATMSTIGALGLWSERGRVLLGEAFNPTTLAVASTAMFLAAFVASLYLFSRTPAAQRRAPVEPVGAVGITELHEPTPAASFEPAAPPPPSGPLPIDPKIAELAESMQAQPETPKGPEPEPEPKPKPEEKKEALADATASAQDQQMLMRFFRDCLVDPSARAFTGQGKMDTQTRFACHLFLLGAGDACLASSGADEAQMQSVIQSALEMLGTDSERARGFVSNYESYFKEPRYRAVMSAGRDAMASFLAGRGLKARALGDALAGWNANTKEAATSTIAVMFTDMVSSVQTTQKLGDEGAMRLVQTHNLIIGSVLKTHRGHQVKHTGDGIMAVFPRVVDGVAAAAEMQRQIDEHNRISMSHPLAVRIGLSAGEPVREDNDYFGTVVQLSARVCAVAGAREVAVSDLVAELAGSQNFVFSEVQHLPLKGFAEPQPVRMLLWEQKSQEGAQSNSAPARRPPPVAQQLPPGHGGMVN